MYIKKHFMVGTGSCRGDLTKMTFHRERVNTNDLSLVGHSFSFYVPQAALQATVTWCGSLF